MKLKKITTTTTVKGLKVALKVDVNAKTQKEEVTMIIMLVQ